MDADEDLGAQPRQALSEEVLSIIMTEPIDPALYDINVEAELATLYRTKKGGGAGRANRTCTIFST